MASRTVLKCGECNFCCFTFSAFNAHSCTVGTEDTPETSLDSQCQSTSQAHTTSASSTSTGTEPGTWNKHRSLMLLELYKERTELFNSSTVKKRTLWLEITDKINNDTNSSFNSSQVEGRWKTMLSSYRKYKDNSNTTGAERKEYEFAKEMDEILGDTHATKPVFTYSSREAFVPQSSKATPGQMSLENCDEEDKTDDHEGTCNKRKKGDHKGKGKRRATSGASQIVMFLETYSERLHQKDEEARKRAEEAKKQADERHEEHIQVLRGLTDALKSISKTSQK